MRILIANCYFAPAWGYGGPTRLLYELAGRLSACGHQVTVITSDASDGAGRYAGADSLEDNVRVVRCKTVSQYLAFQCKHRAQEQVPEARHDVEGDRLKGPGGNVLCLIDELGVSDNDRERSGLEHGDRLIASRRDDHAHRLGEHDSSHQRRAAHAERLSRPEP